MAKIKEKVIEELKSLPEEILEILLDYAEYLKGQEKEIKNFESRYGSFDNLKKKVLREKHSWKEEKDLFEWETVLTEAEKMRRILIKSKSED